MQEALLEEANLQPPLTDGNAIIAKQNTLAATAWRAISEDGHTIDKI